MRYIPVPFGDPIGWKPVNYLLEVGFTRDVWAHRIDIHAAVGRPSASSLGDCTARASWDTHCRCEEGAYGNRAVILT